MITNYKQLAIAMEASRLRDVYTYRHATTRNRIVIWFRVYKTEVYSYIYE